MSYILEALKKSDSERQASAAAGAAPSATYVIAPGRRAAGYGTLLLAGAGMLATGLALGALRPWQAPPAGGTGAPTAALPQAAAAMPPAALQRPAAQVSAAQVSAAQPTAVQAQAAKLTVAQTTVAQTTVAAKPAARPAAQAPKVGGNPAAAAPAKPAAAPAARTPPRPAVAEAPARQAAAEPSPVSAAPRPAGQVVAYQDLPAEIRESVPKVSFGGFAGGDEADGRVAFINNRLVKEGEEVSPGVRLVRVGTDGAVLGYKGHHFRPGP